MIASMVGLLSLATFSSPVIISGVRATRESGHLRVEVEADGGIDPELAHAKIDEGRMFLYLGGTHVRADNRSWDLADGAGSVRAHRHRLETELVVPLAPNGCAGPVELAGSNHGITALVGCQAGPTAAVEGGGEGGPRKLAVEPRGELKFGRNQAASPTPPASENLAAPPRTPSRARIAPSEALAEDGNPGPGREDEKLKALVALPMPQQPSAGDGAGDDGPKASDVGVAPPPPAPAPATPIPSSGPAPRVRVAAAGVSSPIPAVAGATPSSTSAAATATGTAETRSSGIVAPACGLLVLAGAAYFFARRRKAGAPRQIQILETASLGPKRSLIMARIGTETLLIGSSEAGITLLKSSSSATELHQPSTTTEEPARDEMEVSISEALADIPEPAGVDTIAPPRAGLRTIEGGLATFFGRRAPQRGGETEVPGGSPGLSPDPSDDGSFDDILEDSVEDQELRQKLAAGLSARAR